MAAVADGVLLRFQIGWGSFGNEKKDTSLPGPAACHRSRRGVRVRPPTRIERTGQVRRDRWVACCRVGRVVGVLDESAFLRGMASSRAG
jgi:hypothetical protein